MGPVSAGVLQKEKLERKSGSVDVTSDSASWHFGKSGRNSTRKWGGDNPGQSGRTISGLITRVRKSVYIHRQETFATRAVFYFENFR